MNVTTLKTDFFASHPPLVAPVKDALAKHHAKRVEWGDSAFDAKVTRRNVAESLSPEEARKHQATLTDLESASKPNSPMWFARKKAIGETWEPIKSATANLVAAGKDFAHGILLEITKKEKALYSSFGCSEERPTYLQSYIMRFLAELDGLMPGLTRNERFGILNVGHLEHWLNSPDSPILQPRKQGAGLREVTDYRLKVFGDVALIGGGEAQSPAVVEKPDSPAVAEKPSDGKAEHIKEPLATGEPEETVQAPRASAGKDDWG